MIKIGSLVEVNMLYHDAGWSGGYYHPALRFVYNIKEKYKWIAIVLEVIIYEYKKAGGKNFYYKLYVKDTTFYKVKFLYSYIENFTIKEDRIYTPNYINLISE